MQVPLIYPFFRTLSDPTSFPCGKPGCQNADCRLPKPHRKRNQNQVLIDPDDLCYLGAKFQTSSIIINQPGLWCAGKSNVYLVHTKLSTHQMITVGFWASQTYNGAQRKVTKQIFISNWCGLYCLREPKNDSWNADPAFQACLVSPWVKC